MRRMFLTLHVLYLVVPQVASANVAYYFTPLRHPDAVSITLPEDINKAGQIVGWYNNPAGFRHGFLWSADSFTTIDHPEAVSGGGLFAGTWANGINDSGQIIGNFTGAAGTTHGFLLSGGTFTTIDHPNAASGEFGGTFLNGINNTGEIVGGYNAAPGSQYGFLLSEGAFTTLEHPDAAVGSATWPEDINDAGQIVGIFTKGPAGECCLREHGFLLSDGQYTTITHPQVQPPSKVTWVDGINNAGWVVGDYTAFPGSGVFLWRAGTFVDAPNFPIDSSPRAINDAGQIVGTYYTPTPRLEGFLATPVPEPTSFSLLGVGMACVIGLLRVRRRPDMTRGVRFVRGLR